MGVLNWITQGCDALTATASPTIDALGVRMCIALATIMLVWFGVQESLASTHGGQGFHMGKFLSFFMLITFAYTLVRFYDSSIPGVGQSFRGFINGGAQYLVSVIGSDSITSIQNTLNQAQATSGPGMVMVGTDFRRSQDQKRVHCRNRRKVQDGGPRLESSRRHAADDQRWHLAPRTGSLLWHPRPFPARSETGRGRRTNHSQYSSLLPKYDLPTHPTQVGGTPISKTFGLPSYRTGSEGSTSHPSTEATFGP